MVWVYACATLIADELSGYPWDVLDPEDQPLDPGEVPQDLADLLDRPNATTTYQDFVTWAALDLELGGNSYWLKDQRNALGQPFELLRLRPEYVRRAVDRQGRPIGHVYEVQGKQVPFAMDEVVWYRYPDPRDELYGIGTVEAIMRQELATELAATEHVVGFYSQGGRISGVLTTSTVLGEQQWERLNRQFEEDAVTVGSDFRVLIVEAGNKFDPITQAPSETNVVAIGRWNKDRILSAFGVPEPLLGGVLENANYKITDSRFVFGQRVRPKADRFSARTTVDLVDLWDGLQFMMDPTVSEPPHERAARVKDSRGSGMSLNEMRDALGEAPIDDPLADEPLINHDLLPASVVLGLTVHPSQGGPQPVVINPAPPGGPPQPVAPDAQPAEGEPLPADAPAGAGPTELPKAAQWELRQVPPGAQLRAACTVCGGGLVNSDGLYLARAVGATTEQVACLPCGAQAGVQVRRRLAAARPRTSSQRRVRRAKSRFDQFGDAYVPVHVARAEERQAMRAAMAAEAAEVERAVRAVQARLAAARVAAYTNGTVPADTLELPPAPQDQGWPITVPPLPEGFEEFGQVILKRADATMAVRLLAHRHDLLRHEFPVWHQAYVDYFVAQRGRVLLRLQQYGPNSRRVKRGEKKPKSQLSGEALWDDKIERDALMGTYLPLADRVAGQALLHVGELTGAQLRWDLSVPVVQEVRARLAAKVTRVNDTTRQAIGGQVDVGLARGYSVTQIANGVAADAYPGIVGIFDQASRYRAEMIARSETAMVYNDTASAGYRDAGITQVEVIDGTGDPDCEEANGQVWTLDEAEASPIAHPNCVRAFAPILGGAPTEGEGLAVRVAARASLPVAALVQLGQRMVAPGAHFEDVVDDASAHVVQPVDSKPWHVVPNSAQCPASKPYAVVLDSTGNVVPGGCHATRAEADAHVAALYANE